MGEPRNGAKKGSAYKQNGRDKKSGNRQGWEF